MSDMYCPECADKWSGAYNSDHRCVTCGSILRAKGGDAIREHLAREVVRLEGELEASEARLERLMERVRAARIYAGEHLPAAAGTSIAHTLESALKETS